MKTGQLNETEKKQLVGVLTRHVEEAYAHRQDYRDFLDHLIEKWEKRGLVGLSRDEEEAFIDLVAQVL